MSHSTFTLLRQLRGLVPNSDMVAEIDRIIATENAEENVGRHGVGSIVLFKANLNGEHTTRAKVLRNRGVNGKVLYDLALEVTENGVVSFYDAYPLREVDSIFVEPSGEVEVAATETILEQPTAVESTTETDASLSTTTGEEGVSEPA